VQAEGERCCRPDEVGQGARADDGIGVRSSARGDVGEGPEDLVLQASVLARNEEPHALGQHARIDGLLDGRAPLDGEEAPDAGNGVHDDLAVVGGKKGEEDEGGSIKGRVPPLPPTHTHTQVYCTAGVHGSDASSRHAPFSGALAMVPV